MYKTKDNRQTSRVYCVFWKPPNTNPKNAVTYSQALQTFRDTLKGVTNAETSEPEDIDELFQNESFG